MGWRIDTAEILSAVVRVRGKTLLRLPGDPETWKPVLDVEANRGQLGEASFGRLVFTVPHDVVDFAPEDRVEFVEL